MRGSTATRLGRLAWHLASRSAYLPRYFLTLPIRGLSPVALGLPWIPFPAIDFLSGWLSRKKRVFEWGCGGSTLFFTARAKSVVSVEHDPAWQTRLMAATDAQGSGNLDLRIAPFDVGNAVAFEQSDYLAAVREGYWDLIMVDGVLGCGPGSEFGTHRQACFSLAEEYVRPGGIIVVDDIWMFPEIAGTNRAISSREFVGVGPCRWGVTSTAVFFY